MFRLTRSLPVLSALLAAALVAVPGLACANMGDKDVARMVSFGGACAKCELSGRKLAGAQFVGANFAQAALVGSDLRDARFLGANFSGADLSRADLSDAQMVGANFHGAVLAEARLRDVEARGALGCGLDGWGDADRRLAPGLEGRDLHGQGAFGRLGDAGVQLGQVDGGEGTWLARVWRWMNVVLSGALINGSAALAVASTK